ncbi:MAG: MarR family transcriptional regulator [Chloroflexi bacterium]|nr:MarR family transcriptional regulator [Chloroflexota bacterium]MCI0580145.1 MarR family transcriptional regulator [Chloroflexota bacterium]MCI0646619.1 MarR family transcriptional regulator [Chloroflexota bacterium]MCI0730219.1 MarR family transcriptional regulator [Chloroflexota bacterium]
MTSDVRSTAQQVLEIIPLVMRTVAAELRRKGNLLTPSQFGVLVMLHQGSCNLSDLAEYQAVSLPTMSASISTLVERGWVKRTRLAADRRVVMLALTPAGQEELRLISQQAAAPVMALLARLTPAEHDALVVGLNVLQQVFATAEVEGEHREHGEGQSRIAQRCTERTQRKSPI